MSSKNAAAAYHAEREATRGLIEQLTARLAEHEGIFDRQGQRSYAMVGDREYINAKLLDLYRFIISNEDAERPSPQYSVPMREQG